MFLTEPVSANLFLLMSPRGGIAPPAACDDPGDITAETALLIHSNNPDGSTTISDSSLLANGVSFNNQTHHEDTATEFGASSIYFDGVNDYLTFTVDTANFHWGVGDGTIDFWIRFDSLASTQVFFNTRASGGGNDGVQIWWSSTLGPAFIFDWGGSSISEQEGSVVGYSVDTWYHLALVKNGNDWNLYVDGTSVASGSSADSYDNSGTYRIGVDRNNANDFAGYIDEIRYTTGTAIWTAGFTSPTEPYSSTCLPLDGYTSQAQLVSDSSVVDSALADFPIAILPDSSTGIGSLDMTGDLLAWACGSHDTQDLKYNIAVTTSDEYTQVPVESVLVDCANDVMEIHFKDASLSDSADEDFYLYWGGYSLNTEWVGSVDFNQATSADVWDSDFGAVYHLEPMTDDQPIKDSTSNTEDSASNSSNAIVAEVGWGQDYVSGSSDKTVLTNFQNAAAGTLEVLWRFDSLVGGGNGNITGIVDAGAGYLGLGTCDSGSCTAGGDTGSYDEFSCGFFDTGAKRALGTTHISIDTWYQLTCTYANGSAVLNYLDGVLETTGDVMTGNLGAVANAINFNYDGVTYRDTDFDEFRYSDVVRSADWVKATNESLRDTLLTYSTPRTDALPKFLKVSNGDLYNDQLEVLTGWTDQDNGSGQSTQVAYEGFESFYMNSNGSTSDFANRNRDIGSYGARTVASFRVYATTLGASGAGFTTFTMDNGTRFLNLALANNGAFTYTGSSYVEIGTDLNLVCSGGIGTGCWQEWTIDVDWAAATYDLYRKVYDNGEDNYVLIAEGVATNSSLAVSGYLRLAAWGISAQVKAYYDYVTIGSTFLNE